MQQRIMIQKTDAIDRVFPMTAGRTEDFLLPRLSGGAFVRVYDSPAKGTAYRCGTDFHIQDAGRRGNLKYVRIAAIPDGALKGAPSVYVVTAGNTWQVEATVEVYGEEESHG